MAPELFNAQAATKQSDLWALGVVLYEIHELRRPFKSVAEIFRGEYQEIQWYEVSSSDKYKY